MKTEQTFAWMIAGLVVVAVMGGQMTLAAEGDGRAPEIEDHFDKIGVGPGTLDRIRTALGEGGLQDKQIEGALGGMLRTVHKMRAEGDDYKMDPRMRGYFKDRLGLTDKQIALVVGLSRKVQGLAGKTGPLKKGLFTEGAIRIYVDILPRNFDTNKNLTIEEDELETGFLGILEKSAEARAMLLKLFDEDKDGTFNKEETQAVRACVSGLAATLLYDQNMDWQIDDSEADGAWAELATASERHNEGTIRKFDQNRDGKLSPGETANARRRLQGRKAGGDAPDARRRAQRRKKKEGK